MNQPKCQLSNHQENQFIAICLDNNCEQIRSCCIFCVSQFHNTHDDKLIDVEQFYNFIQNLSNQQVQTHESYKQKVDNFQNMQDRIVQLNQFIENILEYVEADAGILTQKQDDQLNQNETRLISIIKESELNLSKIFQQFDVPSQSKPLRFNNTPLAVRVHKDIIDQAIISQDDSIIVSGSLDKTIQIWDTLRKQIFQTIYLADTAYSIVLSSNNQILAYYIYQESKILINFYYLKQNKHIGRLIYPELSINSIVFSQDTKYFLTGGNDEKIQVWSMIDDRQLYWKDYYISRQYIYFMSDKSQGSLYIWNLETKTKLIQQKNIHQYGCSLCSSLDSSIYVTSGSEGLIKIWKFNQFQNILYQTKIIVGGCRYVDALLTMDKLYIISMCNHDGKIMVYERESGILIQELDSGEKSEYSSSISISSNVLLLVSTNFTRDIKVWTRE